MTRTAPEKDRSARKHLRSRWLLGSSSSRRRGRQLQHKRRPVAQHRRLGSRGFQPLDGSPAPSCTPTRASPSLGALEEGHRHQEALLDADDLLQGLLFFKKKRKMKRGSENRKAANSGSHCFSLTALDIYLGDELARAAAVGLAVL